MNSNGQCGARRVKTSRSERRSLWPVLNRPMYGRFEVTTEVPMNAKEESFLKTVTYEKSSSRRVSRSRGCARLIRRFNESVSIGRARTRHRDIVLRLVRATAPAADEDQRDASLSLLRGIGKSIDSMRGLRSGSGRYRRSRT